MPATLIVDANTVACVKAMLEKHWAKRAWMYDRIEQFTTEEIETFLKGEEIAHSDEEKRDFRFVPRHAQFYSVVRTQTRTLQESGTRGEQALHKDVLADQIYFIQKKIGLVD